MYALNVAREDATASADGSDRDVTLANLEPDPVTMSLQGEPQRTWTSLKTVGHTPHLT